MRKTLLRFVVLSLVISMYGCITPGNKERFSEDLESSEPFLEGETEQTKNTKNQDVIAQTQEEKIERILNNLDESQTSLNDAQEKNELLDQQLSENEAALTEAQQNDTVSNEEIEILAQQNIQLEKELDEKKQVIIDLESNITLIQDTLVEITPDLTPSETHTTTVDEELEELVKATNTNAIDSLDKLIATINTTPIAAVVNTQMVLFTGVTSTLDGSSSYDADNDPITFNWRIKSKPSLSNAELEQANTASPEFSADLPGEYILGLTVGDGVVNSTETLINITVNSDSVAPSTPQNLTNTSSPPSQIKLSWTDASDNIAVTGYHIYRNETYLASTENNEFTDQTANENILYSYAVTAYDKNLNESTQSNKTIIEPIIISVDITADNNGFPGKEIILSGSASSNSNLAINYLWSIEAKPATSLITSINNNMETFAFTPDVKGSFTIGLVTSVEGINSTKSITVITALNSAPIAKIQSETFTTVNTPLTLDARSSADKDEDQLKFSWNILSKPAGSNISVEGNASLFNFTPDVAGDYEVQLIVNDGEVNSLPTSLTINVLAPVLNQTITSVTIDSTNTDNTQFNVPVTFGQIFREGDIPADSTLAGRLADGSTVLLQVDKKATYNDGSLRHAIITAILPSLAANKSKTLELVSSDFALASTAIDVSDVLASNYDTNINVILNGQTYSISAKDLLAVDPSKLWLDGPLVKEWHVMSPLKLNNGSEHPHLTAYINVRYYKQSDTLRTRVTLENNWALESNPKNLHYSVEVSNNKKVLFQQADVTHFHHARWTKTFWSKPSQTHVKHNEDYLIQTKAIPNYDSSLSIRDADLQKMIDKWDSATSPRSNLPVNGIMGTGFIEENFPKTGGRPDIGPLPRWAVRYLLSNDQRAKEVTLGTGEQAGSFPIHLRDKTTGLPISLKTYPSLSTHPNIIKNGEGTLAQCTSDCDVPYKPDTAHQASMAFIPYLMTGDHYFLEELIFWTTWNPLYTAPKNHGFSQGLLNFQQVRGQAWSMRTLAQAALFTPDNYPLKAELNDMLQNNLTWYAEKYTNNPDANTLGWVYPISSRDTQPVITPFMDDFFTWSMGYLVSLGINEANDFLHWKAKFAVNRIIDNGYCWVFASPYRLQIADNKITGWKTDKDTEYTTLNQSYLPTVKLALGWLKHDKATIDATANATVNSTCGSLEMAENIHLREGEMVGWAGSAIGFNTALQSALAVATDAGVDNAQLAWDIFMARKIQPNFKTDPQFGIIPR